MQQFEHNISEEFLRTAVIIDDKASIARVYEETTVLVPPDDDAEEDELSVIPTPDNIQRDVTDGQLNVSAVVGAFLAHGIMCGVHQPLENVTSSILIKDTTNAVLKADIVILDWFLKPNDEELILELLEAIFELDVQQNGRLRLIVIYTDNPNLAKCIKLTKAKLKKFNVNDDEEDHFVLTGSGSRIIFLNKEGAIGPATVKEKDIAGKSIEEFSKMNFGLFPVLALAGVNSLRSNIHHLLSIFSEELDPALAGHRLFLDKSDDTASFGLEVFIETLRAVLTTDRVHHKCLSEKRFLDWFDAKFPDQEEPAVLANVVPLRLVRESLTKPYDQVREANANVIQVGKKQFPTQAHKRLFKDDLEEEKKSTHLLSRLSKLSREFHGFHPFPKDWRPTLSIGSIVKRLDGENSPYFICLMPACDAVNFTGKRQFPLIPLTKGGSSNEKDFWVTLNEADGSHKLKLVASPKSAYSDVFTAKSPHKRVLATLKKDSEIYQFTGAQGREYQWLADMHPLHAQRFAIAAYSSFLRVGLDEFEWLRRGL